ncbi:hypothetical protein KEM48_008736 [Puccinia striiformis f. sp. tritici PST-130]|nr:hypothetical protein KEM48_008736 [Puccinia striiformis f. sp. tritici PST-130]
MDNFLTNVPFTTSGALVDTVNKKIIVSLRDGKTLISVLRSYDQFGKKDIHQSQTSKLMNELG